MELFEAFEALNALNEDTFAVSDDGIEKLGTFISQDETDDVVDVIDADAETEEELQDDYVGKVILDCCVCHSKIYKDKSEVEVNEEEDLANVGEDCPYCYTSDGFKVVGEIAPFGETDDKETTDEIKENDDEIELSTESEEEVVEESLTEAVGTLEKPLSSFTGTLSNVMTAHQEELANISSKQEAISFLDTIEPEVKNKGYLATVKEKVAKLPDFKVLTFLYNIILKGDGMGSKLENLYESHRGDRHRVTAELFDILSENGFDTDAEDVEDYVFAARDLVFEDLLANPEMSIADVVSRWFEDTKMNYPEDLQQLTKLSEDLLVGELEEGIFGKSKKQREVDKRNAEMRARHAAETDRKIAQAQADWDEEQRRNDARSKQTQRMLDKHDAAKRSSSTPTKTSNTGYRGINYSGGDYYSESINEDAATGFRLTPSMIDRIEDLGDIISRDTDESDIKKCLKYIDKNITVDDLRTAADNSDNSRLIKRLAAYMNGKGYRTFDDFSNALSESKLIKESTDDLPKNLKINIKDIKDTDEDTISDYLSDTYGFCHNGFNYEVTEDTINVSDIDWDIDEEKFDESLNKGAPKNNSKSIKEDINNLSLDTDDTHMEMTSDESGKVIVVTEPIEKTDSSDETIVPVDGETEEEILSNNNDEEVDVEIDEFDEETFDELGENFLKKKFENVESFKTKNVSADNNSLIIEGVIKFDTGNVKKTSFIFESKDCTRNGSCRFVGKNSELNEMFNFELTGKVNDKRFMSESLKANI